MIFLLSIVLFFVAAFLLILGFGTTEHRILYLLTGFLMIMAATGNVLVYTSIPSYQIHQASIVGNTLYQNLNYTLISVYATGNTITASLGNATSLDLVASGNSIYFQVPHDVYFKLNFTTADIIEVVSK